ncbi:hydrolethalus syndrome protein 1 isoform X1 [Prionailurus iriomotensis]
MNQFKGNLIESQSRLYSKYRATRSTLPRFRLNWSSLGRIKDFGRLATIR